MIKLHIKTNPYPYDLGINMYKEIQKLETAILTAALYRARGKKSIAALSIGINRNTLASKCEILGIKYEK